MISCTGSHYIVNFLKYFDIKYELKYKRKRENLLAPDDYNEYFEGLHEIKFSG